MGDDTLDVSEDGDMANKQKNPESEVPEGTTPSKASQPSLGSSTESDDDSSTSSKSSSAPEAQGEHLALPWVVVGGDTGRIHRQHQTKVAADRHPKPKCRATDSTAGLGTGLPQARRDYPDKVWCRKCAKDINELKCQRVSLLER